MPEVGESAVVVGHLAVTIQDQDAVGRRLEGRLEQSVGALDLVGALRASLLGPKSLLESAVAGLEIGAGGIDLSEKLGQFVGQLGVPNGAGEG